MARPIRLAIIGMGGFAGDHHRVAQALEAEGECRLVCTCDPQMQRFEAERENWEFSRRGVRVFSDYLSMLDACHADLDLVAVPTPVPLHAPMHRAVVERGLACYLEKPPTLDYAEMEEMLAVEERAEKKTQVGFAFIVEPKRQALKRRLVDGEFGAARRACFVGVSPRATTYFERADWAGRLMMDGRLVLDSCIGNAMAHYLHNLLFWCGQEGVSEWAEPAGVQAEMYRAHAIEGTDTVFLQGVCSNGIRLQVAATHACAGPHLQEEWLECERAVLTYATREGFRVDWKDGRQETVALEPQDLLMQNYRAYLAYLRGEADRPPTRLVDSGPFVAVYDMAYVAAGAITTVPADYVTRSEAEPGRGGLVAIDGIRDICDTFFVTDLFPSQQQILWARPGGQADRQGLAGLRAVVESMKENA